jgi:2-polyprenyl-6-methoxyphenol hydroxylase-like FAD-dependent oxidoreductase
MGDPACEPAQPRHGAEENGMPASPAEVFAQLGRTHVPANPRKLMDTAVVLGGSVAGLLAARVLAEYAGSVLIIERDDLGDGERRGVPHGPQGHALLPGGRRQIERWFPGYTERAVALGAELASGNELAGYVDGVRTVDTPGFELLSLSRPFLEVQIRERVLALPNVRVLTGRAAGLDARAGAVTGVRYVAGDTEVSVPAELVVDAMGRASKVGDWLEEAGWARPPLRRMVTNINYATGYFSREPGTETIKAGIARNSPGYRATSIAVAAINAVEDNRWMILLGGYGADRPGRDGADFVARCRTELPEAFGAAVAGAQLGEIRTYHQADSRRRDFDRVRLPAGLVALGDAVASFNPAYGQGLSSAALHASCLAAYLESGPALAEPATMFFDLQRVVVDAAWEISTAGDAARLPKVGRPPLRERVRGWLGAQVMAATVIDPPIAARFNAVGTMLAHPSTLADPRLALRAVVVNRLAPRRRRAVPVPAEVAPNPVG